MTNKAHISTEAFLPVLIFFIFFFAETKGYVIICHLYLTHSPECVHLTLCIGYFCVTMNKKTPNRSKRKDTIYFSSWSEGIESIIHGVMPSCWRDFTGRREKKRGRIET